MEYKDYYKILNVPETASVDEIKKAYRKLARKYHPDISKEQNAESRFKEIGEAYEVLKDPKKRSGYDQLRQLGAFGKDGNFQPPPDWQSASQFYQGAFTGAESQHFSDFFEAIFGKQNGAHHTHTGRQHNFSMRGEDIHYRFPLTLEEAYAGGQKTIYLSVPQAGDHGLTIHKEKKLNVRIPRGLAPGQHIRLKGQGVQGVSNGESGDLYLEIEFAPHPVFDVENKNILLTLPVTPWEAALGTRITIPVLSGKVNLTIPKGATNGQRFRLKGKGLPGPEKSGDQIVILQIEMPASHSIEAETLYAKLANVEQDFNPRKKLGIGS